jgi:hypothetical protein
MLGVEAEHFEAVRFERLDEEDQHFRSYAEMESGITPGERRTLRRRWQIWSLNRGVGKRRRKTLFRNDKLRAARSFNFLMVILVSKQGDGELQN